MDEIFDETVAAEGAEKPRAGLKAGQDLSGAIELAVTREPMDRVRCVRVFGDYYRCNWWAPAPALAPGMAMAEWARQALHRVRKSRFISARAAGGQLVMEEVEN
jgi:hypothetical protein